MPVLGAMLVRVWRGARPDMVGVRLWLLQLGS
jgi:hypothetical protein